MNFVKLNLNLEVNDVIIIQRGNGLKAIKKESLIPVLWNPSSRRLIGKNWTKGGRDWRKLKGGWRISMKRERKREGEFSRHLQSCSRVPVEGRTNSCYFTCSIYYLNASPAAMSRYREISGQTFPAFTKIPRIASNFFWEPRTSKICRGWNGTIERTKLRNARYIYFK